MSAIRIYVLKSLYAGANPISRMKPGQTSGMSLSECTRKFLPTESSGLSMFNKYNTKDWVSVGVSRNAPDRMLLLPSFVHSCSCRNDSVLTSSSKCLHNSAVISDMRHQRNMLVSLGFTGVPFHQAYSSHTGRDGHREADISTAATAGEDTNVVRSDWIDSLKHAWQSSLDAAVYASEKAHEAYEKVTPHVKHLIDLNPHQGVIIPVGVTSGAALLAWLIMPRLLRRFHNYSMRGPAALLSGNLMQEQIPYERSFWGALEDPVRYLVTFMAFSQLGALIAPTTIATQYIAQAWRGAVVLSFLWFLYRWKTNVLTGALTTKKVAGLDRERLLALDKISTVGLLVLGLMASAEACGVAVQSILTVGGIGGVATAFAARDVLGNMLNGLSIQFSRPFSIGDTIKAGSIEGQVVEMGLTTTSLLNSEKFPVIVPNSLFSSQVIVNRSRAQFRAIMTKIPVHIEDLEKIPHISEDIKSTLRSNAKVFLGAEAPYCFLSQIEASYAELTLGYNLKHMSKVEMYSTEQDILLQSVQIIKQHGARLGSTLSRYE